MKSIKRESDEIISARLAEETTRVPATPVRDQRAAERLVQAAEAQRVAANKSNEKLSRDISKRVFSTDRKGR